MSFAHEDPAGAPLLEREGGVRDAKATLARLFGRAARSSRLRASACAVACALAASAALAAFVAWSFRPPAFAAVKAAHRVSDPAILDRNGALLHELRADGRVRRLEWTPLSEVSPELVQAVIAAEDRRFRYHAGFDPLAAAKAAWEAALGGRRRGASTIPMQVASQLAAQSSAGSSRALKGWREKAREIAVGWALTVSWTKSEVLEAYLNLIYFRGEIQGIAAASRGLFGRAPIALDRERSALLAALIRSPNATSDKVAERACRLLEAMGEGPDSCARARDAASSAFAGGYAIGRRAEMAPHAARIALKAFAGRERPNSIATTLDARLQAFVSESLRRQISLLRSQNMKDGAAVVLDNATGDALAYVGGVGSESSARHVDGVRAHRQAGSTLKPFLYGRAIDERLMTAATLLRDSPFEVSVETGSYAPQNYDRGYKSFVSARVALASSLNVPAVRVLETLGVDRFVETLRAFGIEGLERPDFYGPSLALGSADVTLWDLANAYRALANGGVWSPARLLPSAVDGAGGGSNGAGSTGAGSPGPTRTALSPGAAHVVASMLSDREARSATFGLENSLATRFWTAVKTGTSKDMRDNWTIGFSSRYTVAVWTGNFSGEPMWNVSGVHGAAPVWLETMNWLHATERSSEPPAPPGLVRKRVAFVDFRQEIDEWFLPGTEPEPAIVQAEAEAETRVAYPVEGTVIALDPRIPEDSGLVHFHVLNPAPGYELVLDGRSLGPLKSDRTPWKPTPGRHALSLYGPNQTVLQSISFQVRGRSGSSGPVRARARNVSSR